MDSKLLLSLAILLSFGTAARASSGGPTPVVTPSPSPSPSASPVAVYDGGEIDTAHDKAENDPSIKPELTLEKPIPQEHLLLHSVSPEIEANVKLGYSSQEHQPNYAQVLQSQPELFNYFSLHEHRYVPKVEYGPTVINADVSYVGVSDRKYGYCWGYSTMVRYFTVLAFYDANQSNPAPTDPIQYQQWIDFYKGKIDQVVRGEATLIPGFRNFRELSLVPELELYLKLVGMELWRSRAVRLGSISIFRNATKQMNYDQVTDLLNNLEARIARGELPKVVFSSLIPSKKVLGLNTDIHVVLPYQVERLDNNQALIHIWDIDFYTETLVREPKMIIVTSDHLLKYEPWYEPTKPYAAQSDLLASVAIPPENDGETIQMVTSLKSFCTDEKTAQYCIPPQD